MKKREAIIDYIVDYSAKNHFPPTNREIGKAVGLRSPATVSGHLHRLRKGGRINFIDKESRTLTVPDEVRVVKIVDFKNGQPYVIELEGKKYVLDNEYREI
ncbi:hypothetical protein [Peribacillus asahii]|uniref:LexA family protein n=1 Tax=Peribacillus asahii TaxID=228899 RepID=UPI00207AB17A|nr:hypothetical protein [Peribacillus asahii]USK62301.1 hypothetical protein LIT37_24315 [Peribacillus asahii]